MEKQFYKLRIDPKPNNSIKRTFHRVKRLSTYFEMYVRQSKFDSCANSLLVVYATVTGMCEKGIIKTIITIQNVMDSVRRAVCDLMGIDLNKKQTYRAILCVPTIIGR